MQPTQAWGYFKFHLHCSLNGPKALFLQNVEHHCCLFTSDILHWEVLFPFLVCCPVSFLQSQPFIPHEYYFISGPCTPTLLQFLWWVGGHRWDGRTWGRWGQGWELWLRVCGRNRIALWISLTEWHCFWRFWCLSKLKGIVRGDRKVDEWPCAHIDIN